MQDANSVWFIDSPLPTRLRRVSFTGGQTLPHMVTFRQGGQVSAGRCVFITWKGDQPPRHVHVYRVIVKWDLDNQKAMKGAETRRILDLINELEAEGLL
jgi:hypothetical protein